MSGSEGNIRQIGHIADEGSTLLIQPVQAVHGPDPEASRRVPQNGDDDIVAQRSGVVRIVSVREKMLLPGIEPVKAPVGPQPESVVRVTVHGLNEIVREGVHVERIVLKEGEFRTVVTVEP